MRKSIILASMLAVSACTAAQNQQAAVMAQNAVVAGQLFCGTVTKTGPLIVALADASGAPVTVTGKASVVVADACAVIGGIPVSPPANPAAAPVVAAPVAVVASK